MNELPADPAYAGFRPPFYLRSPFLQTFLGSKRFSRFQCRSLRSCARPVILSVAGGVRLSGALSTVAGGTARGLVILLHGWEGSIESTYVVTTAQYLFDHGFNVFRLDLRDHGDTHHLNQGLFYATALEEVHEAVMAAARLSGDLPVFLCGFSLGGNFALRIARDWSQKPAAEIALRQVTAISPVLNPAKATDAIDADRPIRSYFIRKWKRSLKKKQELFPLLYHFEDILGLSTVRQMTEKLLQRYSSYPSAAAYFEGYTVSGRTLAAVTVPTTIITSQDDPIIPVEDFYDIPAGPSMRLFVHPHGGHNGFIRNWRGNTWYEDYLIRAAGL